MRIQRKAVSEKIQTERPALFYQFRLLQRKDYNALLKMRVMQIVHRQSQIQVYDQSQKLYACWKYVVSDLLWWSDPNIYQSGWARSEALRMFLFWDMATVMDLLYFALAKSGYAPYMICGRVPGRQNGRMASPSIAGENQ